MNIVLYCTVRSTTTYSVCVYNRGQTRAEVRRKGIKKRSRKS